MGLVTGVITEGVHGCRARAPRKRRLGALARVSLSITILGVVLASGGEHPALAQDTRPDVLEAFIKELAARGQFNGTILIAEHGDIIYERAIGQRSATPGDTLDLGSQFRLASASKPFTALAIMQLQEAGVIDYDDPVEKHIPEWPYAGATIRNLLNHTSGIPDYERDLLDLHWKPDLSADDPDRMAGDNDDMIQMFVEHLPEPYFEPGEEYGYSDTGYILLATIVERASGIPFHQYMRESIFLPVGMQDTYAFSHLRPSPLKNRAYGMSQAWDGSGLTTIDFRYVDSLEGSSGIYSTVGDLYRFDRALYTGQLVSEATLEEAYAPGVLNNGDATRYGFGWSLHEGAVSHDGYAAGFGVWINRELEDQDCIVILTNSSLYLWAGVIQGLVQILNGGGYELPKLGGTGVLGRTLVAEGEEAARDLYADLRGRPDEYELGGAHGLNTLARLLLRDGYDLEALVVFRLNSEEHGDVAHVWDSLGDGYLAVQDTVNAVASYQKALSLDQDLRHATQMLQLLERR